VEVKEEEAPLHILGSSLVSADNSTIKPPTAETEDVKMEEEEPLSNEFTWRKWKKEIIEKVKAAKKLNKGRLQQLLA